MVCSNCGNEITAQREFCSQCDTKTGVVQSEIQGASNPSSLKRKSRIVKIFLLPCLREVCIFLFLQNRSNITLLLQNNRLLMRPHTGPQAEN